MHNLEISNISSARIPRLPFFVIKNEILGEKYRLSLAFVDKVTSRSLNKRHRGLNNPTNVLSFALTKDSGEIVICPQVADAEAKNFGKTRREFLGFLVIHAMLHLKGMEHGAIMEHNEEKYDKKYFGRTRYRYDDDKSRGR